MAKRELSITPRGLRYMRRAAQREEKAKKEEEAKPEGSSTITRKWKLKSKIKRHSGQSSRARQAQSPPPPPQPPSLNTRLERLESLVQSLGNLVALCKTQFSNNQNQQQAQAPQQPQTTSPPLIPQHAQAPQQPQATPPPSIPQQPQAPQQRQATPLPSIPQQPPTPQLQAVPPQQVASQLSAPDVARRIQFLKINPPKFDGVKDIDVVDSWLMRMETLFGFIGCSSEERVTLATFMFGGEALYWWNSTEKVLRDRNPVITWDAFLEAFNQQYFSKCAQQKKQIEFLNLTQGNMTVDQYESKFTMLCHYDPDIARNEVRKTMKFVDGLKPSIRGKLVALCIVSYAEAIMRAQLVELDIEKTQAQYDSKNKAKGKRVDTWKLDQNMAQHKRQTTVAPCTQVAKPRTAHTCSKCGKDHGTRPCYWSPGACFNCGKIGHRIKDCPTLKAQGRVFF